MTRLRGWAPKGERLVDNIPQGKRKTAKETGRPCYATLPLLKAIYLQALYDLSDPGLEEALADRLSFRRFCGYGIDQPTPDETTICRFRNALAAANVLAECFAEVNAQLEQGADAAQRHDRGCDHRRLGFAHARS
jgi:transposase